jgi:hypothetical protein
MPRPSNLCLLRDPRLALRDLEIDLASLVLTVVSKAVHHSAKEYQLLVAPVPLSATL